MKETVVVRGGGDIATGVIQKLWRSGFKVAVLEIPQPLAIRRTVSLCRAVTDGSASVEDMTAVLCGPEQCAQVWSRGEIPVIVDPECSSLSSLKPKVLVDAILAKRNTGTGRSMAPATIALGPGFTAPDEVDAVIETMRGHYLGRLILRGGAMPDTGKPGDLSGGAFWLSEGNGPPGNTPSSFTRSSERVIYAPGSGVMEHIAEIGQRVRAGDPIFKIASPHGDRLVCATIDGTLRGLLASGIQVENGLKCADIDPRPANQIDCVTISDKARALGGAVLEAVMHCLITKKII